MVEFARAGQTCQGLKTFFLLKVSRKAAISVRKRFMTCQWVCHLHHFTRQMNLEGVILFTFDIWELL